MEIRVQEVNNQLLDQYIEEIKNEIDYFLNCGIPNEDFERINDIPCDKIPYIENGYYFNFFV